MTNVKKQKAMAALYIDGPEGIKGDWNKAAEEAGYKTPPDKGNKSVLNAMAEYRGERAMEEISAIDFDYEERDWHKLALQFQPLLAQIASGLISVKPAQVKALESIMLRGMGKVVEVQRSPEPPGIVVLPTIGEGAEMQTVEVYVVDAKES